MNTMTISWSQLPPSSAVHIVFFAILYTPTIILTSMTIISQLPIPSKQENHRCDILPRLALSVWEATKTYLGWRPAPSVDVLLGGQTL